MYETIHRLVRRDTGAGENGKNDREARQIFHAAEAISESPRRSFFCK
jgi:hypothetical protein